MIAQNTIDKVLDTARIEDVVGDHVSLKKRGVNMIGLCPFHDEKTPSFIVSPAKGIYKCFGCGMAGNSVKFLMEHEHFSYPEALKSLAQRYGIEVEETGTYDKNASKREGLYEVCNFAQQFFTSNLFETEEGKSVGLSYFKERGYREDIIKKFQLGYATEARADLLEKARIEGYGEEKLQKTGLISKKDTGSYDFFRARVMFPIHNATGKIIAFAGRTLLSDAKIPKYINSPETDIYVKSNVLFGAYHARNGIRNEKNCFLVEGYTDVLSLHQEGIENVVASSGTALTKGQIKLLKRYTDNITLLYDGDEAGVKAATRGLELVLEEDMNVRIVILPDKEDPDSFIRNVGTDAFRDYVTKQAKDYMLFKTDVLVKESANDPAKKAGLIREIVETISRMPDPIKRSIYIKECSTLLDVGEQLLIQEINRTTRQNLPKRTQMSSSEARSMENRANPIPHHEQASQGAIGGEHENQERDLLRVVLEYGDREMQEGQSVAAFVMQELQGVIFDNAAYRAMLEEVSGLLTEGKAISEHFMNHPDPVHNQLAIELMFSPYELSENWEKMHDIAVTEKARNYQKDIRSALTRFKLKKVLGLIKENEGRIKAALSEDEEAKFLKAHAKLLEWKRDLCADLGTVVIH